MTSQVASAPRLVPFDAVTIEAVLAGDRATASRHLGATVPEAWPEAELRSALPVHLERLRTLPDGSRWGLRAIVVDGELVGSAGFKGPPGADRAVEIGYGVVPAARGQGLATVAAATLVEWAFQQRGVRRVRATIAPDNRHSQGVARAAGLHRVGVMADAQHGVLEVWEARRLAYRIRRLRRSRTPGHSSATME